MLTVPLLVAHLVGVSWAIVVAIALFPRLRLLFRPNSTDKAVPSAIGLSWAPGPGVNAVDVLDSLGSVKWYNRHGYDGYCPLMQMLALLPFNRVDRFTLRHLGRVVFLDPCIGGIVRWSDASTGAITCCSIQNHNKVAGYSIQQLGEKTAMVDHH